MNNKIYCGYCRREFKRAQDVKRHSYSKGHLFLKECYASLSKDVKKEVNAISIKKMPQDIFNHILSFIPTKKQSLLFTMKNYCSFNVVKLENSMELNYTLKNVVNRSRGCRVVVDIKYCELKVIPDYRWGFNYYDLEYIYKMFSDEEEENLWIKTLFYDDIDVDRALDYDLKILPYTNCYWYNIPIYYLIGGW